VGEVFILPSGNLKKEISYFHANFPGCISKVYHYLFSMSDDDLNDFYINDESCRAKLFEAMGTDFTARWLSIGY
jgi:hypothetical protein